MDYKVFKTGKSLIIFELSLAILLIILVVIIWITSGQLPPLIPPLGLAIFILIRFYIKRKKPIFLISENEVEIFNPPRKIPADKIAAIYYAEEKKLELILTDSMHIPLFLHDLSKADRKDLKHRIKTMINRVKKAQGKIK